MTGLLPLGESPQHAVATKMAALRKNSAAAFNAKWERLFPFRLSNALGNAVADIRWATEIANHSDTLQVGV